MATEPSDTNPLAAFGANEWLVDELYEKYQQDPNSVDPAWLDFFKTYKPGDDATPVNTTPADAPRPDAVSDNKTPEAPSRGTTPSAPASSAPAATTAAAQPTPAAAQAAVPQTQPAAKQAPARTGAPTGGTVNQPPSVQPKPAPATNSDGERQIMRGAPARTAQNMETSLTVPTATSVRQVPVKLLIDNRIVINNHLKRARGGKVSFTHLIG